MSSAAPLEISNYRQLPLWCAAIMAIAGGLLYAGALPPLNWFPAVIAALALLDLSVMSVRGKWQNFFCGWLWGCAGMFCGCFFLREINWCIPFLIAPVLGIWSGVFALGWSWNFRAAERAVNLPPAVRHAGVIFAAGTWWMVLEWSRCRLFVWNDSSVTVWRFPVLFQFAEFTGRYGISFLLAATGAAVALLVKKKPDKNTLFAVIPVALLWIAAIAYGIYKFNRANELSDPVTLRAALIQGNLPQMRRATAAESAGAVDTYVALSRKLLPAAPELIIWPECAVPVPLRANMFESDYYRRELQKLAGTPLLIGTLDFPDDGRRGLTNGALLIGKNGMICGKYDKFHRVPFGEYVPFRTLLPEFMISAFDMGRDLCDGKKLEPLEFSPDIRIGCAICYEGVFSYVTRGFARNGANLLAALSNDVWYPESSEPEQHLANAVIRCVETGLPMIRCSNNGGSGVITPAGKFTCYIGTAAPRPELLREQAAGIVEVTVEKNPPQTVFVRFGNWFVYVIILLSAAMIAVFSAKRK